MKSYNPTSKSRREMTNVSFKATLTASRPHKALTGGFQRAVGRNNKGRLTTRHKGGGRKRLYRDIDFVFDKKDIPAKIETIEYDPNRTAFIALALYQDGERRYVVIPQNVKVGDSFVVSEKAPLKTGNRLPLSKIPVGTFVYNVETKPLAGGVLARSAGNYAEVAAIEDNFATLKMPSTEIRKVLAKCWASIGAVSNEENWLINIGKAGRSRWYGIRPTVRGTVMNPVDHPHGGGEGKQGRGRRREVNVYGKPTGKGQKTRNPNKYSNSFIVSRRRVGKKKE
ncbi:MAG: 50S ribosomal protein L2 [Candidatus Taylorbacteria bacterium RIFCSPHIGHO2_02_FULL_44_36]|uniref:Large ribosomal subunit protein uL2 n=1 Tax=Candidatus Taylorbacteria bacterium RIFCSPLOWO2_12_FULL_44_15c TaxID=1802333 RepID=A0A1G2P6F0_9BACT|nr:MAG: 50S ribosomal protein L2 [Candidatus Taylorbacteria bacterium RIFCSPHIGHO2_02_FULL_44_36]OHA38606.1 MAG: 50S ribosomal protein L2 [Candidatus Taylorbacteria bacterium RIFCSPLOWO2_02_FULL_44_35]OHA43890.1 MAG: 50S ribosomal protein L2 [Candidatus Taylorbacteria bacterium RIFCSPLOWO2_12_FULL_44_15c]